MAGTIILFILITRTAWRVYKKSKSRPYVYPHLASFLLITLIFNLSEVSFGAWSDLMWTMLLFIYFMADRSSRRRRRHSRSHANFTIKTEESNGFAKRLLTALKKKKVYSFLALIGITSILSIVIFNEKENSTSTDHLDTSEVVTEKGSIEKWRGLIFAPEYKTNSEDYVKEFELLVTEALFH